MAKVGFVIAGAQKSGTTALHAFLRQHPGIFFPEIKELHHFDKPPKLIDRLGIHWRYHRHFRGAPRGALRGEATPIYMFWPGVMTRIARYNPAMRIVIILREPGARAYSHWQMESARGRELRPFAEAIRSPEPDPPDRVRSFLSRGFYTSQLSAVFDLFPRDQVLVCLNDDLRTRPGGLLAEIEQHLGLSAHRYTGLDREIRPEVAARTASASAMAPEDRAYLTAHFAEEVAALAALLGRDLSHWQRDG